MTKTTAAARRAAASKVSPGASTSAAGAPNAALAPVPIIAKELRPTTRHTSYSCRELMNMYQINALRIPDYQREFVWPVAKQRKLIMSMLNARPMPCFIFSEKVGINESNYSNIIDGRQRLGTIYKFVNNMLSVDVEGTGDFKVFRDLSIENQCRFDAISLVASVQSNCNAMEEAAIFEDINSGMSLTSGERLQPCEHTPFAKFAQAILDEFNDDLTKMWGNYDKASNRHAMLMHATGMVAGAALGQKYITSDFPILYALTQDMTVEMLATKTDVARANFRRLVSVWNEASAKAGMAPKSVWRANKLWSIGTFTGYLLFAFWEMENQSMDGVAEKTTTDAIIGFLADCMRTPDLLAKMHALRASGHALNRERVCVHRLKYGYQSILRYATEGASVFAEAIAA